MARPKKPKPKGKRPPHPKPVCRICGTSETRRWTEEHAYPDWLRRFSRGVLEYVEDVADMPPHWQNKLSKLVLKPVCIECQERLNETFEKDAADLVKSLIVGLELIFTPRQQVLVAGWFVKTALIVSLARSVKDPNYPQGGSPDARKVALQRMLQTGVPPAGVVLRLAYTPPDKEPTPGRKRFPPPGFPGGFRYDKSIILSTWLALSETTVGVTEKGAAAFVRATENDDRFVLLWPPHVTDAHWPPNPISPSEVDALRNDWKHLPEHRQEMFMLRPKPKP